MLRELSVDEIWKAAQNWHSRSISTGAALVILNEVKDLNVSLRFFAFGLILDKYYQMTYYRLFLWRVSS